MKNALCLLCGLVVVAAVVIAGAWAQEKSDGKVVAIPTDKGNGADALVSTREPSQNNGAGASMGIKSSAAGGRVAVIRFDLSEVQEPINWAALEVRMVGGSSGFQTYNVFGMTDGEGDKWIEGSGGAAAPAAKGGKGAKAATQSAPATAAATKPADGITAETAPFKLTKTAGGPYAPPKSPGGVESGAVFLGTMSFDNTGYKVTKGKAPVVFGNEKLVEFLRADTNKLVTIIITRTDNDAQAWNEFGAKEGKNPAVLKVSSETRPFPQQPTPPASAPASGPASKPASGAKGS
jgi:hypothetical protein